MSQNQSITSDVQFGKNVKLSQFANLYGCEIGDETKIGAFVEVQKNARIGRRCKISSHSFICEGVTIEDNVFVGHGVTFINDSYPRATTAEGGLQTEKDWNVETTLVKRGASIGSGATILSKVVIGENAIVGAGSVVTRNVPPNVIVAGNPAKVLRAVPGKNQASTRNGNIPFVDLATPHQELEEELVGVFRSTLRSAGFVGGPMVEGFEGDFARFCDSKFCIGVSSGTDALRFALMATGLQPGEIVLTVPLTFIATTEAISQAGGRIDFVDIDARSYTMDPQKLRQYLENQCVLDAGTGRLVHKVLQKPVAAVIPVHLYGQPVDMDPILEIAARYKLAVIEDACQAHGAEYYSRKQWRWKKAGSMGRAAAFSFYPGKNLGACGEAGAITTDDEILAQRVRMLRDHGQSRKYYHQVEGYNGRLDALQAGMLQVKLRRLSEWNESRREAATRYRELFNSDSATIKLPHEPEWVRAVYHLFVIRTRDRDGLQKHLAQAGIGTGIHYPIPLHLQEAYEGLGYKKGDFPVSEEAASEILSLPMYPGISVAEQRRVAEVVAEFTPVQSFQ
ncbi:MAG TPA: DegT/DnrJ/EryC1/StrS family aminotransferase [Candidatus Acidoferrum sp.]|nr:DegT/DnrJ/EryC1/StrS family aminotransferase [Candidatus Acidoferrum sp.]